MTRTLLILCSFVCLLLVGGCSSDQAVPAILAATRQATEGSAATNSTVTEASSATALPGGGSQTPGLAAGTTPQPSEPFSAILGELLANPAKYDGQPVEVVGYFRGWDLLGEATGSTPVTRSDWVITDASGSMYVTGKLPASLDPSSKEDAWVEVRLKATFIDAGKAYLKAESVEIIP